MNTARETVSLRLLQGRHRTFQDGYCVMELTSTFAGEPHSSAPSCTHPVLAAVAVIVNDSLSDSARQSLAVLAPQMVGMVSDERAVCAALTLAACEPAVLMAVPIWRPEIQRAIRRARVNLLLPPEQKPVSPRELRAARRAATRAAISIALGVHCERDSVMLSYLHQVFETACAVLPPPGSCAHRSEPILQNQ